MMQLPRVQLASTAKYQQIEDLIREKIETDGIKPGSQLPSETAIAQQINAHRLTVNKAMSNLVASGYLYRIHGKGTFVADKNTVGRACHGHRNLKTVLILFVGETASDANVYLASPYQALCAYLGAFEVIIKTLQVSDFADCEAFAAVRPDICVIFTFKEVGARELSFFERNGFPVILFGRTLPGTASVNMDNEACSRALTEELIGGGHTCIPFLYANTAGSTLRERLAGYRHAMERHALRAMPIPLPDWLADSSREALARLSAAHVEFSAAICEGVCLLQGARQWRDQRKGESKREIALACLDNWGGAFGLEAQGDYVVETPLREMGKRTGELLMEMLEGKKPATTDIVVAGKLIRKGNASL